MSVPGVSSIQVTVDKSHLVTIGERLYQEAVELLRELVSNAYDADATEVEVRIAPEEIRVADDGSGMDLEGLRQYFTIGSPFKRMERRSPRFNRDRIGEFGIGKFAALSACDEFEVCTRRGGFAASVVFDKRAWESAHGTWDLPLRVESPEPGAGDGTVVTLRRLRKRFDLTAVERRLRETLPLTAKAFRVVLNGHRLEPTMVAGRRLPFLEGTEYGVVHGELVIRPAPAESSQAPGVGVRVREVLVCHLPFGLAPEEMTRLSGEVHADFLLVTSDRTGVVQDSPEFAACAAVMARVLEQARKELDQMRDHRENRRVSRALKEVVGKIEKALFANQAWCPPGLLPEGPPGVEAPGIVQDPSRAPVGAGRVSVGADLQVGPPSPPARKPRRPRLRPITPSALVKKLRLGRSRLAFILDHLGPVEREAFTEGEVIYINRDHPLYLREASHRERHIMHVARLIAQEVAWMSMKQPQVAREAFERQSRLLRDAFQP